MHLKIISEEKKNLSQNT